MSNQICEWKELPKNMNNKLHTICSYMAMFPPSLPHYFIQKYSNEGDVVLDPYSGRGTTVLEACLMSRIGIGNDKNILAHLLTKAKSDIPAKGRILSRINQLEKDFNPSLISLNSIDPNVRMIFSDTTLSQMAFLKDKLNWRRSNVDSFIAAMVLGIMHGNSEGYLSVSMPNTFSMAPNYVRKYIHEHNLQRPIRDTFALLRRKLERCYQKSSVSGKAYSQDARKITRIKNSSVDLIVTSPPYTRVIRYGQFNWIRLWFLGKSGKEIDKDLFFSQSIPKYSEFMVQSLQEMKRVLKPGGKAVLIIGDVKDRTSEKIFNLAQTIWDDCAKSVGFKLMQPIIEDAIRDDTKVSKIWGETKGNATKKDRILILEKTDSSTS